MNLGLNFKPQWILNVGAGIYFYNIIDHCYLFLLFIIFRVSEAQAGFQWCIDRTEEKIKSLEKNSTSSSSSSSSSSSQKEQHPSENMQPSSSSKSSASMVTGDQEYDIKDLKALLGMCLEAYARFFTRFKKYDDAIVLFTRALSICEDDLVEHGQPHQEVCIVAGQEKPCMCIWPLNMNLLSNKREDLNKISFIHVAGAQLNQQKPLNVFKAIEHVLN